jgi:glycosyltransferase involved in cell wall biosynthesis
VSAAPSRLALAFEGDSREPSAWSGIPRNLADAFEGLGIEVEHASAEPGRIERLLRRGAPAERASAAVSRRLNRIGEVDVVLQLGSEFSVPDGLRVATFDDMTVVQARRLDHPLLHGLDDAEIDAWADRQRAIFERAEACFVAASWAAESVIGDYGIPEGRVHVVGFGRNLGPRPVPRDWLPPRYLFVGQDWRRKGGNALLAAFREVRDHLPDATLTVIGAHPGLDNEPGVVPLGGLYLNRPDDRERMVRAYESSTCLVVPSQIEPAGIVYLEAAAAGVPSIGTTIGGASDLIGQTGRLVAPGDQDALVAAMVELGDPETAQTLGDAARRRADWFTWPAIAKRIATVLDL